MRAVLVEVGPSMWPQIAMSPKVGSVQAYPWRFPSWEGIGCGDVLAPGATSSFGPGGVNLNRSHSNSKVKDEESK